MLAKLRASATSKALNTSPKPAKLVLYKISNNGDTVTKTDPLKEIPCLYRPKDLTFDKGATWNNKPGEKDQPTPSRDVPKIEFSGGTATSLTLDFVFDTTEDNPLRNKADNGDVRFYTKQLLQLVTKEKPDEEFSPPLLCQFQWGVMHSFVGCVTNVNIHFTLFNGEGKPIRAKAKVQLKEYHVKPTTPLPQNPTSRSIARKTWVVEEGQRLDWIAYQEYGAPRYWRHIAEVNGLSDPTDIYPGKILKLTPLHPEE